MSQKKISRKEFLQGTAASAAGMMVAGSLGGMMGQFTTLTAMADEGTVEFSAFFAMSGSEINSDNEIAAMIAEQTGASCDETWLTGQTS
ncbi:MAG: hypothetical protein LUD16_05910, partial [Lachnospiraceae bacterium]|nr:hypothetical protein [Lachnospiraceae bacterium]